MSRSDKPEVIEWIFFNLKYDSVSKTLNEPIVFFEEIVRGIQETGDKLETNNPANFWKDITRSNPNTKWPESVFKAGYTGEDAIGEAQSASFKFAALDSLATEPFPDRLLHDGNAPIHMLQSLSMPVATKSLSRTDENWLTQVSHRLNVLESYLAIFSSLNVTEVTFLQTGVKLKRGEVDAVYLATIDDAPWLLSVEVKGRSEDIHVGQVLRASTELLKSVRNSSDELENVAGIVPFAMKAIGKSSIWVVEFEQIVKHTDTISKIRDAIIEFVPEVPGIG